MLAEQNSVINHEHRMIKMELSTPTNPNREPEKRHVMKLKRFNTLNEKKTHSRYVLHTGYNSFFLHHLINFLVGMQAKWLQGRQGRRIHKI
jgi:hypothetical protein